MLLVLYLGMGTVLPKVQTHPWQISKSKGYTRPCLKEKRIDKIMWSLSFAKSHFIHTVILIVSIIFKDLHSSISVLMTIFKKIIKSW